MQAVILAAGKGVRMRPLTDSVPKPLLKVAGRSLIEYTFAALPKDITEVVMVIGYRGEQIQAYLGDCYGGRRILYAEQEKLEGTAKALWEARQFLSGRFLVLMADDLYAREDIEKCLSYDRAMLVKRSDIAGPGGLVVLDDNGRLKEVVEGKNYPAGALNCLNVFVLDERFFDYEPVKLTDREGEWGLPQTVVKMARDFSVSVVEAKHWIKITEPEDLKKAEKILGMEKGNGKQLQQSD